MNEKRYALPKDPWLDKGKIILRGPISEKVFDSPRIVLDFEFVKNPNFHPNPETPEDGNFGWWWMDAQFQDIKPAGAIMLALYFALYRMRHEMGMIPVSYSIQDIGDTVAIDVFNCNNVSVTVSVQYDIDPYANEDEFALW